jgi:hypothetical protein
VGQALADLQGDVDTGAVGQEARVRHVK